MLQGEPRRARRLVVAFAASIALIGIADIVLPPSVVVLPFLVIPVVGSVTLASERITLALLLEAIAFSTIAAPFHQYPFADNLSRLLTFAFAAAVSAFLARELRRQRALSRAMLDAGMDPVMLLRAVRDSSGAITDFRFADANPATCAHYRRSRDQLIGMRLRAIADPSLLETGLFARYCATMASDAPLIVESMAYPRPTGGAQRHLDIHGRRLEGDLLYVTWRDVSEQVTRRKDLHRRATHDDLTGAMQRGAALARVDRFLREIGGDDVVAAALFIDLDDFKRVNDEKGHAAGDAVLIELVQRIRRQVRVSDVVSRLGGDEFLVLLPEVRTVSDALAVAEKIRANAAAPVPGCGCTVTVSVGVAMATPGETVDALVARADRAMFRAKAEGRDRVVLVDA